MATMPRRWLLVVAAFPVAAVLGATLKTTPQDEHRAEAVFSANGAAALRTSTQATDRAHKRWVRRQAGHAAKHGVSWAQTGVPPQVEPPHFEIHPNMREPMPSNCTQAVTQAMGYSDYGTNQHTCTACSFDCTEGNKQQATGVTWLFEPTLDQCNAFHVKAYVNLSNIEQLGCDNCTGTGLHHKIEFEIASNARSSAWGVGGAGPNQELSFKGHMGPQVMGGPRLSGSASAGKHIFEMYDTLPPSHSKNCNEPNPSGRWLVVPGEVRANEMFKCTRECDAAECKCDRRSHVRCEVTTAMTSGSIYAYSLRRTATSATGNLAGKSLVGTGWEVRAHDVTMGPEATEPSTVVGRVVLAGNPQVYGIRNMWQTHHHVGCTPCDLFYASMIATGPFVLEPANVHVVKSADGVPPKLTDESCELYRISSLDNALSVKFETGPGLWPPFEVNDTIFTCSHSSTNTCER